MGNRYTYSGDTADCGEIMPDFIDIINNVHGFISLAEMQLLYDLAAQVPKGGNIVEIGAAQGRSTLSLALGAKEAGAMVYSIDPHDTYTEKDTTFGMADNQAYYSNLAHYNVGDVVRTINLPSMQSMTGWFSAIELLWIDGSHEYLDVRSDFEEWSTHVTRNGKIAFHDTAGFHIGVTQLVDEILAAGQWIRTQQVDAISVFERVK